MPPIVYISGPYTQGEREANLRNAVAAANLVADHGGVPFVPHLSFLWHLLTPRPYEFWLTQDLEWVRVADAVYRLPGYSPGAEREVALAQALGKPVLLGADECVAWLQATAHAFTVTGG